uniref:Uncharacterized protein n=1 Tax=uncultured prokaryote TaxID=198431 RepID=A0A0H5Q710_9ZZZZ|nr:hypothetical protein [uncultured prokaryote]
MKRPEPKALKGQYPLAEMDVKAFTGLPNLRSFFMDAEYSDGGGERQQGQAIIRAEPGRWCLTLKEPTTCQMMYLSAPNWAELLKLADGLLGSPDAPWATDTWAVAKKPKGAKK